MKSINLVYWNAGAPQHFIKNRLPSNRLFWTPSFNLRTELWAAQVLMSFTPFGLNGFNLCAEHINQKSFSVLPHPQEGLSSDVTSGPRLGQSFAFEKWVTAVSHMTGSQNWSNRQKDRLSVLQLCVHAFDARLKDKTNRKQQVKVWQDKLLTQQVSFLSDEWRQFSLSVSSKFSHNATLSFLPTCFICKCMSACTLSLSVCVSGFSPRWQNTHTCTHTVF